MNIVRASRWLLGLLSLVLAVWSFDVVGRQWLQTYQPPPGITELTIVHWGTGVEEQTVAKLVEGFERAHPEIHIRRICTSDPGQMESKVETMFGAGTPPDVFYLPADTLPEMQTGHLLMPLQPFIDKERAAGTARWIDDFYPILIDCFRYDGQKSGTGMLYGIPKDFTTMVMYVNLDLFKRAGLRVPYDGWSWDEYETDIAKIGKLKSPDGHRIYGSVMDTWSQVLRNVLWTFGGDYFGKDFHDIALDSPQAQKALEMICRQRFVQGTQYVPAGADEDETSAFLNGHIGIYGPVGRWITMTYRQIRGFEWDVVPVPYGTQHASALLAVSWSMSAFTKHPDEAWTFIKYMCGPEGQAGSARLGIGIPAGRTVAESNVFLDGRLPAHTHLFLDAMKYGRIPLVPPQTQFDRIVQDRINNAIQLDQESPLQAAKEVREQWLALLDSPLNGSFPTMRWGWAVSATGALLAAVGVVLALRMRRQKIGALDSAQERAGWVFIAPWVVGFFFLTLGPVLLSLLLSACKWSGMTPLGTSEFVGTANYQQLLGDAAYRKSVTVTCYYVLMAVPLGQLAALLVALLMNNRVRGIHTFRTIFYVPSVIAGVALATIWLTVIFNNEYGLLAAVLQPIWGLWHSQPPDWFGRDAATWALPGFVLMSLWGVGSGMIIYLAGLKGIPVSLYEAATIDGAGIWRRLVSVTLPMLSPLIFYNVIMGLIGSFQMFTQAFVMPVVPGNNTLFYVVNMYRNAFEYHQMGYACAMAWVLFVIVVVLTAIIFRTSRNIVYYEGLRA